MESLIKAGAFDSFGASRAYQLSVLGKIMGRVSAELKERANGQEMLFQSPVASHQSPVDNNIEVEEFSPEDLLRMEKEMLGMYISSHPLQFVADSLEGQTSTKITDISEMREGNVITIGGLLSSCRRITTKKGDLMMIGTIEDLSGDIQLIVFPKTYKKCSELCNNDQVVVVKGKVNRDMRTDEYNVVAESVDPMAEMEKKRSLHIELVGVKDPEVLSRMKEILLSSNGGDPVIIRMDGKRIELGNDYNIDINPDLMGELEKLLGSGAVNVEFRAVKKETESQEVSF
jgi:DNA polymerase-3 subunit alpha